MYFEINFYIKIPYIFLILQNSFDAESVEERQDSLSHLNDSYISGVNNLILGHSVDTAVTFLNLPQPPGNKALYSKYLKLLTDMTDNLKATVMVHGVSAVTTTNL